MVATVAVHTGIPPQTLLALDWSTLMTMADVIGGGK